MSYTKCIQIVKLMGKKSVFLFLFSLFSGAIVPMFYIFIASKYTESIRFSFISSEHVNDKFISSIFHFIICFIIMNLCHLINFYTISKFLSYIYWHLTSTMFRIIYSKKDNRAYKSDIISSGIKTINNLITIVRMFLIFWSSVIFDIILINFYVYLHNKKIGILLFLLYLSDALLIYILIKINNNKQKQLDSSESSYDIFMRDALSKHDINILYNLYNHHNTKAQYMTKLNANLYGHILFIQLSYEIFIAIYNVTCMSLVLYLIVKNTDISSVNKSVIFAMLMSNLADLWKLTKNIVNFVDIFNAINMNILISSEENTENITNDFNKIDIKELLEISYKNQLLKFQKGLNIVSGNSGSGKSLLVKKIMNIYKEVVVMTQTDYLYDITTKENIVLGSTYNKEIFLNVIALFNNSKINNNLDIKTKNTLSGGETKIVCFMRTIYHILIAEKQNNPYKVVILDEPFNHIDKNNIEIIKNYINNNLLNKYIVIVIDHGNYLNLQAKQIYYI